MQENLETCCICLEKSIFTKKSNEFASDDVPYVDKLKICVPTEQWVEYLDVCMGCIEKLDVVYNFIQLCIKSEEYRKALLKLQIKDAKLTQEIKEETFASFTCYICSKSFRLKRTLSLHITRIHLNPKKNVKRKSGKESKSDHNTNNIKNEIKTEEEDKKHLIIFDTENKNKTKEEIKSDKTFSDSENNVYDYSPDYSSTEELLTHKEKKPYKGKKRGPKFKGPQKCQYCLLEFTRTDRYVQHVRSKHTFEKPFKCDLCDAKYYSQHNLNIHIRKHKNERPFICSSCGKSFVSSNDLWQHNKTHDNIRQYGCDECDRSFKTHSNLRTHKLQMHQDPESWKFICTVCGKKFPLNNNLIKHMRRHEGIKDFLCHLCEKKFVEKIDLQTHLMSHSNERHFKCGLCLKDYKKKETLRRHMKIEHDLGNFVVKTPEKKLNCPVCPKIFAYKNKLQRHILTHTGEKPVKCDCCDKRFRDNYDRNSHLRQVHNIEPKNALMHYETL